MTALVRSEWLRLRSRYAVVALLLGALGVSVLLTIGQIVTHEDDYAAASQAFRAERIAAYPDELAAYELTLSQIGPDQMPVGHRVVTLEEYASGLDFTGSVTEVPSRRFVTTEMVAELAKICVVLVALAGFLAGASFVGHEWQQRTLHALVVWEPRRGRVVAAKAADLSDAVALALVAGELLVHALGYLGGRLRGTVEGTDGAWWLGQAGFVGRGLAVTLVAALAGATLALLSRSAAFAIAAGLVQVGLVESFVLAVRPDWQVWTFRGAANAVLDGGTTVVFAGPDGQPLSVAVTAAAATATLAAYLLVVGGSAVASFVRRDLA